MIININGHLKIFLITILIPLLALAVAWGAVNEKVKSLEKTDAEIKAEQNNIRNDVVIIRENVATILGIMNREFGTRREKDNRNGSHR